MDGYGRWGHDFKSRASTVLPSRLETVTSLIQPKVADHGFESRLPLHDICADLQTPTRDATRSAGHKRFQMGNIALRMLMDHDMTIRT